MEFVVWLLIQARERLWNTISEDATLHATARGQGTLDTIHVLNEIIAWTERSHYGDSGEILPVASVERQAFYDVLTVAIKTTIGTLEDWGQWNEDDLRRDMVTHAIALDTVATKVCQPYYVSQMMRIAALAPIEREGENDGTAGGPVVADDDGQRGHDPECDRQCGGVCRS